MKNADGEQTSALGHWLELPKRQRSGRTLNKKSGDGRTGRWTREPSEGSARNIKQALAVSTRRFQQESVGRNDLRSTHRFKVCRGLWWCRSCCFYNSAGDGKAQPKEPELQEDFDEAFL